MDIAAMMTRMDRTIPKMCNYVYETFETSWEILTCMIFRTTRLVQRLEAEQPDSFILSLIRSGFDPNKPNKKGETPLHIAVTRHKITIAHELIKRGADVNAQNNENATPLHYAVFSGNLEAVGMLLYYGADVDVYSKKDKFAFTYALENIFFDIFEILANYYSENFNGLIEASTISDTIANKITEKIFWGTCDGCDNPQCFERYEDPFLFTYYYYSSERYNLIRMIYPFLVEYADMEFCCCSNAEWLNYIYLILEASTVIDLAQPLKYWTKFIIAFADNIYFFRNLYYSFYFRNVEQSDRLALTYMSTGLGIQPQPYDISFVHKMYGFNEELEALLYGTTNCADLKDRPSFIYPLSYFILALDEDYNSNLIFDLFRNQIEIDVDSSPVVDSVAFIIHSLSFFSLKSKFKQQLQLLWMKNQGRKGLTEFSEKVNQIPEVPSLVELARNQARVFIKQKFDVKKPYHFHDAVKSLKLPSIVKDIIRFKKPLYV